MNEALITDNDLSAAKKTIGRKEFVEKCRSDVRGALKDCTEDQSLKSLNLLTYLASIGILAIQFSDHVQDMLPPELKEVPGGSIQQTT